MLKTSNVFSELRFCTFITLILSHAIKLKKFSHLFEKEETLFFEYYHFLRVLLNAAFVDQ